ncbi:MAG TPA: histidine kinase [Thermoleophilaceae bacterium]|jgi:signal transduction histidine kinase
MNRARALADRVRGLRPEVRDRILLALFLAGAALEVTLHDMEPGERAITAVAEVAIMLPLLLRRRSPALPLVVWGVVFAAQDVLGGDLENVFALPFVVILFYAYALGAHGSRRELVLGIVASYVGAAYQIVEAAPDPGDVLGGLMFGAAFLAAPIATARSLRNRRLLAAELSERAERAESEREERARRAVEDERARIARELHDVVAHSISVMTVQAEAVHRIAPRMPEQARTSLETIENTGREALTEMRRLLGVLRRDDEGAELAPQPSLGQVRLLAQRARAAGLPVELAIEGEVRELSPGVDLAAYRVVQEALTEALARAGARSARVLIRYGERDVRIEIADDGAGHARAAGDSAELLGMRERVALYGGELETGPGEEGGFRVRARLPLGLVRA